MQAWKTYLYYLLSALDKLPDIEAEVFRGVTDPKGFVKQQYTPGTEIHWSSFSSSTTEEAVARKFARKEGVLFKIRVFNAKDISHYSIVNAEKELLLSPNINFLVSDTSTEPSGLLVVRLVQKKGDKVIF
jgi:hypothetical protein